MLGSQVRGSPYLGLAYIQCMLGSRVRGSPCFGIPGKGITLHRLLWDDDDDTSESGIENGLNEDKHV
jgi:hypothetical protein